MSKTHYRIIGNDCRDQGQTDYEYNHTAACGYVRENVTLNEDYVDCKLCLKSKHMEDYHHMNSTFTDSSGCY